MTYYDELGVTASASSEEIRESYRQIVKLLHPDRHEGNPELRRLAELQIKRLNEIVAILGNSEARSNYDKSLNQDDRAAHPSAAARKPAAARNRAAAASYEPRPARQFAFSISRALNQGMWVLTLLIGAGALGWFFASGPADSEMQRAKPDGAYGLSRKSVETPRLPDPLKELETTVELDADPPAKRAAQPDQRQQPIQKSAAPMQPAEKLKQLESKLRQARMVREAATKEAGNRYAAELAELERRPRQSQTSEDRVRVEQAAKVPSPPINPAVAPAEPAPAKTAPSKPAPAAAAPEPVFRGHWTYRKAPKKKDDGLFPPEFIEMTIEMRGEVLWGSYRAKYEVPSGRKISPDVQFQFIGKPTKSSPQFLWSGKGGAKGVVELKFVDDRSMEVNWTATNLGQRMGLVSGTAVLERRR